MHISFGFPGSVDFLWIIAIFSSRCLINVAETLADNHDICAVLAVSYNAVVLCPCVIIRVPTGRGKLEKVGEFWWSWENILSGKVGEDEKLVPPDVRFSG